MSSLVRFGVSVEKALLGQLDARIAQRGYASRSEALRDLMRHSLSRAAADDPEAQAVASLTLLYGHHSRQLADCLVSAQHRFHHIVLSNLHAHLDAERCLEVLVLKGRVRELQLLADGLIATKGVTHGQLVLIAEPPAAASAREHAHPHES